jgi:acetyl esterase/lipase
MVTNMQTLFSGFVVVCLLSVGLAAPSLAADAPPTIDVWPGKVPDQTRAEKPEKSEQSKIIRIGDISKPTLTIYHAPKDKDTGASILICPGGGYSILAWDLEGTEVAQWLNSVGVTGIVLKYRVPEHLKQIEHFPPLEDAQRGMSLLRSKAKELEIDPKRIGMLGFSAGGNLTALACTNYDRRSYESIDEVDRVSCRPDFGVLIYPAWLVDDKTLELKPEFPVTAQTPQMFFVHASDDKISAASSAVMYLALKHAKVPAEVHIYAKGGHGFGLRPTANPCSTWPQRCEAWMRSQGLLTPTEGSSSAHQ